MVFRLISNSEGSLERDETGLREAVVQYRWISFEKRNGVRPTE